MLESEIQNQLLLRYGTDPRVKLWRSSVGAARTADDRIVRFGLVGQTDIIGLVRGCGTFLGWEIKTPKGRLSVAQVAFGNMITSAGGVWACVRSEDDCERSLREHVTVCPLCGDK